MTLGTAKEGLWDVCKESIFPYLIPTLLVVILGGPVFLLKIPSVSDKGQEDAGKGIIYLGTYRWYYLYRW